MYDFGVVCFILIRQIYAALLRLYSVTLILPKQALNYSHLQEYHLDTLGGVVGMVINYSFKL